MNGQAVGTFKARNMQIHGNILFHTFLYENNQNTPLNWKCSQSKRYQNWESRIGPFFSETPCRTHDPFREINPSQTGTHLLFQPKPLYKIECFPSPNITRIENPEFDSFFSETPYRTHDPFKEINPDRYTSIVSVQGQTPIVSLIRFNSLWVSG